MGMPGDLCRGPLLCAGASHGLMDIQHSRAIPRLLMPRHCYTAWSTLGGKKGSSTRLPRASQLVTQACPPLHGGSPQSATGAWSSSVQALRKEWHVDKCGKALV